MCLRLVAAEANRAVQVVSVIQRQAVTRMWVRRRTAGMEAVQRAAQRKRVRTLCVLPVTRALHVVLVVWVAQLAMVTVVRYFMPVIAANANGPARVASVMWEGHHRCALIVRLCLPAAVAAHDIPFSLQRLRAVPNVIQQVVAHGLVLKT